MGLILKISSEKADIKISDGNSLMAETKAQISSTTKNLSYSSKEKYPQQKILRLKFDCKKSDKKKNEIYWLLENIFHDELAQQIYVVPLVS